MAREIIAKVKFWFGIEWAKHIFDLRYFEIEQNDEYIYIYKKEA